MSTLSYARKREKDRERERKIEIAGLYYKNANVTSKQTGFQYFDFYSQAKHMCQT